MMLVGILEKIVFPIAIAILYEQNRVAPTILVPASIDLILGVLFLIAYLKTSERENQDGAIHEHNF